MQNEILIYVSEYNKKIEPTIVYAFLEIRVIHFHQHQDQEQHQRPDKFHNNAQLKTAIT